MAQAVMHRDVRMARAQEGKLRLPEAQHVSFDPDNPSRLADLYLAIGAVR